MNSVAMVLAGGVCLGAYQAGAYAAMSEPLRERLDSLAGASIGAVNAALIAGIRRRPRNGKPDRLTSRVVAVVNPAGRVVPPESLLAGALRCARCSDQHVLWYEHDRGPALQHLGPLVWQAAHSELWPQIVERLTEA